MTYRLLQPNDLPQFIQVFEKAFGRVPDISSMTAVLALEGDEIVGFGCLYQVTVADSMWIAPQWRRKGVWRRIIEATLALPWRKGEGFYLFEGRTREGALAKKSGATKLPFNLWRWRKE